MLHGPYYKWTRKVAGKTVNATLTPEQAARFEGVGSKHGSSE